MCRIFNLLDIPALLACESVCKAWKFYLQGPDERRYWRKFCDRYYWCPKVGWENYLARPARGEKSYTVKEFYKETSKTACSGCHRPTAAYSALFGELICLGCRYRLDKYFYYSATDICSLQLSVSSIITFFYLI